MESLETTYKIKSRRHQDYPNLVLLKYDMIESPMDERIVQECRGIILDEKDNWKVISRPYDKFFNIEEVRAAKIDWSTAKVWEKLDGSLFTMYWYDNQWMVASSGMPDALGNVANHPKMFTFHDLFWNTFANLYKLPDPSDKDKCFMFELMTPFNRVVVKHDRYRCVLHGARYIDGDMEEMLPQMHAEKYGWECVKSFPLQTVQDVQAAAAALNPLETEGFIVSDMNFNRVKVKSPAYVALHHMISGMSKRKLLEVMRLGEMPEVLSYYPEWAPTWELIDKKMSALVKEAEEYYSSIATIEKQKDFAARAKEFRHSGALFAIRSGKVKSIQEYFATMNLNTLENLLGLEEDDSIESSDRSGEGRQDSGNNRSDSSLPHSPEASPVRGSGEELPAKD